MKYDKAICVYGASRDSIDDIYKAAAHEVGYLTAIHGAALISGGGRGGLMRSAIDGAIESGGVTIGVLPRFMTERQWQHPGLTEMITEPDMHSRKATMAHLSTAIIAMPGGVGTLDELMEIITWRQLGLYKGNVVILNTCGYYDPLLEMLQSIEQKGFMREGSVKRLWQVAATPAQAVDMALSSNE
ncbi:MAG: TIGR00730 family Rossman fold protein [Muribaculaceae bacterium]|nr:TIGR00730 family Rossman fold protein [Muribaculaceae bacterium]